MHKEEQLAELSNSTLGMVLTINESSHTPRPIIETAVMAAAAVPIEAGTQRVEIDLQVTWLLSQISFRAMIKRLDVCTIFALRRIQGHDG